MERHQACAVTWARAGQFGVVLHCHHLVAGSGRKDDPRNLLSIEQWVHDHYHSGGALDEHGERLDDLTPGHLMWVKRECDYEHYDEVFICQLLGRVDLPDRWRPEKPPEWVFQTRERNLR